MTAGTADDENAPSGEPRSPDGNGAASRRSVLRTLTAGGASTVAALTAGTLGTIGGVVAGSALDHADALPGTPVSALGVPSAGPWRPAPAHVDVSWAVDTSQKLVALT